MFEGLKLSPPIELEAEEEEGEKKIWSKTVDSRPTPTCHEGSASLDRMTIDRKSSVGQILFTLTLNNEELDVGLSLIVTIGQLTFGKKSFGESTFGKSTFGQMT